MSFSLKLLGGAALTGPEGGVVAAAMQRHRVALLANLAVDLAYTILDPRIRYG